MDHLLMIDKVPIDESLYPKAWLVDQIIRMCKKHYARILDPSQDIYFEEDEYEVIDSKDGESVSKQKCYKIAVILDGWDHL